MSAGTACEARRGSTTARIEVSRLYLTINQKLYQVEPLACGEGTVERAFRLNKGDGTRYDVSQTRHGACCDCPDFIFRREGLDPSGCKHVQAMVKQGLILNLNRSKHAKGTGRAGSFSIRHHGTSSDASG